MSKINTHIPESKGGFASLKANWKSDLISGFLVFLIALPLCLGIAMASGFPPIGGIITAIIGGLVVSPIMGSRLTIKGPAAGLIAISIAAVMELGQGDALAGYKYVLAIVVVTGAIQVVFGLIKLGKYVDFFPSSAVHGMLAAIGIIIIVKQFPSMIGSTAHSAHPFELMAEIPSLILHMNPEIALIGGLSLGILFGLPLVKHRWVRKIPAPMLVLLVAIPLGRFFDLEHQHQYLFLDHQYFIGPAFLVTLPARITDGITFPDFGMLLSLTSLKYLVMFVLVGSLESLLTVKAIDELDPNHGKSDPNKDIFAVGIGNTIAGFLGGLPMIAEVVRSGANLGNGAKTQWSNFFHGLFLLVFVAFLPNLIHQIPLAALAAMLVYTGFRLASPRVFRSTLKIGKDQLAIFLTTIVVTLAEDLLMGIFAGILLKIILHVSSGVPLKHLFKSNFDVERNIDGIFVRAKSAAVFSNFLGFKKMIDTLPKNECISFDFSEATLIDHTFMEQLAHFKHDCERAGGTVVVLGVEGLDPTSSHALASRKAPKPHPVK
jgi:MFS superfamily sulfate permease-like transporter